MHEFLVFTISGLTTAGIYAISASGLTLTYVATGTFNVAHGATGMVAAFTYWQLRYDWGWPVWLALLVCVGLLAPLLGIGLDRAVMRRLAGTSAGTRLVVTVAVLVCLVSVAQWIWDPTTLRTSRELFAGQGLSFGDIDVPYHDLVVLGVAAAVAVGLWLLLHRSRIGVAMRATVDDRSLAVLNGARPEVVASVAWAVGTALAALAGILLAPKLTMSAIPLTLLIVNAYAAAVIGRLHSLPMTFVGALLVGLASDYGIGYLSKIETGGQYLRGFAVAIPVVVLLVGLLLLPAARLRGRPAARPGQRRRRTGLQPQPHQQQQPQRERERPSLADLAETFDRAPSWRGSFAFVAAVFVAAVVSVTALGPSELFSSAKMWGLAIVGLSLVPLYGYGGRLSLCQLSFAAIGAIVVAHVGGGSNPLALLLAAAVAATVGALVSLPALRLSGIYLALLTGAFAVTLDQWIFQLPKFTVLGYDLDLFQAGSLSFQRFAVFGLSFEGTKAFFLFGAGVFGVLTLVVVAVRRSEFGQRLIALDESPAACATLGMNLRRTTLANFTLSAAIAGVGGGVYGGAVQSTTADPFSFFSGLSVLLVVVVMGASSPGAALAAGLLLGSSGASEAFGDDAGRNTALLVGLAALALAARPEGVIPGYLRPAYAPVVRTPAVLCGALGVGVVVWGLFLDERVGGSVLALALLLVAAVTPSVSRAVLRRAAGAGGRAATTAAERRPVEAPDDDGLSAPLEKLGLEVPFTPADVEIIERRLALAEVGRVAARS